MYCCLLCYTLVMINPRTNAYKLMLPKDLLLIFIPLPPEKLFSLALGYIYTKQETQEAEEEEGEAPPKYVRTYILLS